MKKIKLNESDIERLVKKIIKKENLSEIDKKTWASAAEKARNSGMGKLGDKFASHGRERGTSVIDKITFQVESSILRLVNFDFTINGHNDYFVGETEDGQSYRFNIMVFHGRVETYLHGDSLSWPISVKDAKNYLTLLNDNGFDTEGVKPKQITLGYVNENIKRRRKIVKEDNVSELDKSTYASASEKARNSGMGKLGDRFDTHAREHGNTIESLSFDVGGITKVVNNIRFNAGSDPSFSGDVEGKTARFMINIWKNKSIIYTYMYGDIPSWPTTVRDAKNYLTLLNNNDIDTFGIKPKQIASDYVNENVKRSKKIIKEVGGYDSPMELGRHSSGYMRILTDEVDNLIDSLTKLESILPEVMDDNLHESLDKFLEHASIPLESLNDEIENASGRIVDKLNKHNDWGKGDGEDNNPF